MAGHLEISRNIVGQIGANNFLKSNFVVNTSSRILPGAITGKFGNRPRIASTSTGLPEASSADGGMKLSDFGER